RLPATARAIDVAIALNGWATRSARSDRSITGFNEWLSLLMLSTRLLASSFYLSGREEGGRRSPVERLPRAVRRLPSAVQARDPRSHLGPRPRDQVCHPCLQRHARPVAEQVARPRDVGHRVADVSLAAPPGDFRRDPHPETVCQELRQARDRRAGART